MNPIEQIWKEIRKLGFKNELFKTLDKVIDRLCDTISSLAPETIRSITGRDWILSAYYLECSIRMWVNFWHYVAAPPRVSRRANAEVWGK